MFAQQRSPGTLALWGEPFVNTRIPWIYNLRTDPFERATITSNTYWDWYLDHAFMIMPAQAMVQEFLATFKDYPPRQMAASFTIDQILEQMTGSLGKERGGTEPTAQPGAVLERRADAGGSPRAEQA